MDLSDLPNLAPDALMPLDWDSLRGPDDDGHPPRILLHVLVQLVNSEPE